MELALVSEEGAASVLKQPIEHGLCAKLMGLGPKAKILRSNQVYGCRHCKQIRSPTAAPLEEATSAPRSSDVDENGAVEVTATKEEPCATRESPVNVTDKPDTTGNEPGPSMMEAPQQKAQSRRSKKSPNDLFTFDGLRCHLKGKCVLLLH